MKNYKLILPERCRRIPLQFSWVDQRLVRDGYFERLNVYALALYLFLLTVCNADGLSWYSDERLCREIGCDINLLRSSRYELCVVGLIAWRYPLYQVLALDPLPRVALNILSERAEPPKASCNTHAVPIGEVLKNIFDIKGGTQ